IYFSLKGSWCSGITSALHAEDPGLSVACKVVAARQSDSHELCSCSAERLRLPGASGSWEPLPPMRHGRLGATAGAVCGAIYVCGGLPSEDEAPLASVEKFCALTGSWEPGPPMTIAKFGATSGILGDKIYVCGGFDG
ncbi:unnamed protein product, partial [Polarella glacialis]